MLESKHTPQRNTDNMGTQASKLEQLREMTVVVADTGEIGQIERFRPVDATTNPSLLLKAAQQPGFDTHIRTAIDWAREQGDSSETQLDHALDRLAVDTGMRILELIPGRVSTEVDARLSFDTWATIERARKLIRMYNEAGIDNDRVLIKIASTWEGIHAARQLEQEGIHCNLTLLFGFCQAVACADAGVTLISPFVGRILDWHKQASGRDHYPSREDPGVISVTRIYNYYKSHGYDTIVMGASFRNTGEIEELAGCDRLTIGPALLEALDADHGELPRRLDPENLGIAEPVTACNESSFRWALNADAMATEKLAEGIRNFAADAVKLENLVRDTAS